MFSSSRNSVFQLLLIGLWLGTQFSPLQKTFVQDPGEPGPCSYDEHTVDIGGIETLILIPINGSCDSWANSPFPGLVFVHGFTMFGLTNGVADVKGNGEHLASWGYITAIPMLPDDAELRTTDVGKVIDYLLESTNQSGSILYQKIDLTKLAVIGYSLGGSTALATTARDMQIKTVVALDPVYHEGGFGGEGEAIWNPEHEGKMILVPAGILGSPQSSCNAEGDYENIFSYVGATHKAAYLITDASHCDFLDPGNSFCTLFCTGTASPSHTRLSQQYMTAWLNYYLMLRTEFSSYLFGSNLKIDVNNGAIEPDVSTAPKGMHVISYDENVNLSWDIYTHPIIAGYNIHRRDVQGSYPPQPLAVLGKVGSYTDQSTLIDQEYFYKICSYDLDNNQHPCSKEIFTRVGGAEIVYLPILIGH